MIQTAVKRDRRAGWSLALSLALHLLAVFIYTNADMFRPRLLESTPYYVDIISLPVTDPAPTGGETTAPAPPAAAIPAQLQPPATQKPLMALPAKQPPSPPAASSATPDQKQREQETREFTERMRSLERGSDARHQAEALAALQKKISEKKGPGISSASGLNPGSDYGAYIQSRLKDALSTNIVYRSQNPEAAVHLYIDRTGKLIRYVMVRPSADKLFNSSVIRTIEKAKADFPPVPSGAGFDKLYLFSPLEVKK